MSARLHTGPPRVDPRFPHWAPALGAIALPYADPRELGGETPAGGLQTPESDLASREPVPEVVLGLLTAGASGALTGGVAAGSWAGAAVGTALNVGLWSLFTLVNSWRDTGRLTRTILGIGATVGAGGTVGAILYRRREA